jgi:predicted O-methyltransferase YrrM
MRRRGALVTGVDDSSQTSLVLRPGTAAPLWPTGSTRGAKRMARTAVGHAGRTKVGRSLLEAALKDEENAAWLFRWLCDWICAEAEFDVAAPARLAEAPSFDELVWLFSSHALNQRLSRLELEEAAHLYRLVRRLDSRRVAELGRYKGGTTFLLAAAGAQVTSLDLPSERQAAFDGSLERTLARFGLADRVELVLADSHRFPVDGGSLDVVFVDGDVSEQGLWADWEQWWPAVAGGGSFILHLVDPHEIRWPILAEKFAPGWRFAAEIEARPDTSRVEAPAGFAHFVKAAVGT